MTRDNFIKFANWLGFKINEEAFDDIEDDDDVEGLAQNVEDDEPVAKAKTNKQKPAADTAPKPVEIPDEIMQLNELVKEIGGVEAMRNLLLSAATVTANALTQEQQQRERLTGEIIANSSGMLTAEDLEEVSLPVLQKMAVANSRPYVDYSALGAVHNVAEADKPLPRPSFLLAKPASQEAN